MTGQPRSERCEEPESQLRWGRCACRACKIDRASAYKKRELERLKKSQITDEQKAKRSVRSAARWQSPEYREAALKKNLEWRKKNPEAVIAKKARARAAKKNAVPLWYGELDQFVMVEAASLCRLREDATGFSWQIDHMIPIKSVTACGLHCGYNLQVIPAFLNRSKKNKMIFTEPFDWLKAA